MPESLNRHDAEITALLQAPGLHVIHAADVNPFTCPGDALARYPHELSVRRIRHTGFQMFSVIDREWTDISLLILQ